ncbi:HotDog domain-containing protein [Coniella lustricola]|uniref:HotDog domain-containing protein n=1 Tax=Coniella lustricola TaxID=2025994 RepID=A0A2T3ACI3_9PEZI|nr:HotDog domain-containing protein [Coniella lustricola]
MAPPTRISSLVLRNTARPLVFGHSRSLARLPKHSFARLVSTTVSDSLQPPRPSFIRRAFSATFRAVLFTTLGFIMSAAPAYSTVQSIVTPKSDAETLTMWVPTDDAGRAHEDYINAHPAVLALRANPNCVESRPHLKVPPAWRAHNLTAGVLIAPNCVPFPPVAWLDATGETKEYVQISYVGEDLCGHPGIVHGGYLATVLDEGLARSAFAALPHRVGLTANLNVNYKAPCVANQYIVLRGEVTRAEGRKVWTQGRIETLPKVEGEAPVVLADATALYIEPKQAAVRVGS